MAVPAPPTHFTDSNMITIFGYLAVIGSVIGGFIIAGGHVGVLMQPVELLIIGGAAMGAFFVSNMGKTLKATLRDLPGVFKGSKYNKALYIETLLVLNNLFQKIRKDGLMAIEGDIDAPEKSELFRKSPKILADHHAMDFIVDYLRIIASGNLDTNEIDNLMDLDIETHHEEGMQSVNALQKLADGMPAFGIVAAVMGVVHTMESVGIPPAELGKLIAAALVGTFLGILIAYGFVGPLAVRLEQRLNESSKHLKCIKAALLAYMNGSPPPIAVEFGRKVIYSVDRPGFQELEKLLRKK